MISESDSFRIHIRNFLLAQKAVKDLTSFLVQWALSGVPESLLDSLTIAVSLALTSAGTVSCTGRRFVSDAAHGTALLKTGTGLCPLKRALSQQHGLEHWKIVTLTALLCSQQHAVCLISCFLRKQRILHTQSHQVNFLFISMVWFFVCGRQNL